MEGKIFPYVGYGIPWYTPSLLTFGLSLRFARSVPRKEAGPDSSKRMKMIDYSIEEEDSPGAFRARLSSRRLKFFTPCKKCWQRSPGNPPGRGGPFLLGRLTLIPKVE
jgi:hypothetical protein